MLALALALAAGLLAPELAGAQESSRDEIQVVSGRYKINVVSGVPVPAYSGDVHFVITVLDSTTDQPVPGARVRILTSNQADGSEGWAFALNGPDAPERYLSEVKIGTPGTWDFKVEVSSALGEVIVELPPREVRKKIGSSAGGFVLAGVFLVLLFGGIYVVWTVRREQRRRISLAAGDGNPTDGQSEH